MKPNFALSLSFEGISLFHRTDRGWHLVGEIPLDSPDFSGELETLRKTAKALDNHGLATKLILPNDQIRYLDVKTGKVDDAARIEGARLALDGATPYAVDDLAISASAHGAVTHVAAVAHETLQEAEAFAVEHKFNPVCFVAVPENANYLGEPFFGLTSHAKTLPGGGADIGPEAQPVRVTASAPVGKRKPDPATPSKDAKSGATPTPKSPADPAPQAPPAKAPKTDPAPTPSFHTSRKGHSGEGESAPMLSGVSRLTIGGGDAPVAAPSALADDDPIAPDTTRFDARSDAPKEPGPSLRDRMRGAVAPLRGLGDRLPRALPASLLRRRQKTDPEQTDDLTPDRLSETAEIDVTQTEPAQLQQETDSEARRMTVFGAREETPVGGKPRYLGLVLTILLLLFLVAVATWASVFTDEGIAGLFKRDTQDAVVASAPLTPALDQDSGQPSGLTPAQPETITDSAETEADAEAQETPTVPTAREAEAHYAVTGIWQIGPEQPTPARALDNESLYVASIDSLVSAQDAVLIPAPERALTDVQPQSLSAPAAAGTTFQFDDRGLVVATRRGALTPDGITVYRGPPAAVPTRFPERITVEVDTQPAIDRLALVRPRARPGQLLENNERARNGGLTQSQLASKRPKARPATAKFELEKDLTPTAQAVAVSRKPKTRPENFSTIVETALAQKTEQQDSGVVQVAAAAPAVRSTPRIPTTASVARQATVKNVINLRKLNLIGVYGKPSSRRALVRLSSGRYKKVKVGDRIDGGKISAIGETELRYTKGGRNVVLKMPKT